MSNQVLGVATQVLVMAIVISLVFLFVGIGILVVIHFCIVGRAFRRGFGNRNSSNDVVVERGGLGSRSMSREDVEKLPCFDFKAKEIKGSTTSPSPADCAVCLENFKAGEKCRLLPLCRHSFHAECVDMWLLRTPLCPICRASADLNRAAEESSRHGATGSHLTATSWQMIRTESGRLTDSVFATAGSQTAETNAGDEILNGLRVIDIGRSTEIGTPVNGGNMSEREPICSG